MWHCLLQSRAWHNYAPDMKKLDGISFFLILVMTVFLILFGTMMQLYFSVIAYVVMTAPNQLFFSICCSAKMVILFVQPAKPGYTTAANLLTGNGEIRRLALQKVAE
jgi:hypothetical protein